MGARLPVLLLLAVVGCAGSPNGSAQRQAEPAPLEPRPEHHPPYEGGGPSPVAPVPPPPEMPDPAATPGTPFANAKAAYSAGTDAYNLGDYDKAVRDFTTAFELTPEPAFIFNIAQAHRLRGDVPRALHSYRLFLRLAPNHASRGDIEERIRELEERREPEEPVG